MYLSILQSIHQSNTHVALFASIASQQAKLAENSPDFSIFAQFQFHSILIYANLF